LKYYIISGEASGDLHASNLIKSIRKNDISAEFRGVGGDLSAKEGLSLLFHYKEYAFMGFIEVLLNLRHILKAFNKAQQDILKYQPDVLILVDYPGFNLRMAAFAKKHGLKVVYYISPKIWAWNTKRVFKIKKNVDLMLSILPFEEDFYKVYDVEVKYVGNPLYDSIHQFIPNPNFKSSVLKTDKKILAILPGSRKQELKSIYPVAINAAERYNLDNQYQIVVAMSSGFSEESYQNLYPTKGVLFTSETYNLLNVANKALVTSGTAVLETAMFKVPQLALYRTSRITYWIAKQLIKVKYITLPNLILNKNFVKELIQDECNPELIVQYLQTLDREQSTTFEKETTCLLEKLKPLYASDNAAKAIDDFINEIN
jgi:lipid-A-disaccharide synthase